MILYANGCSWTWGGSLDHLFEIDYGDKTPPQGCLYDHEKRLPLMWPQHLGNLMNVTKVINDSEGGGSNQRLFRTTLDYINNQSPENLSKTIFILQFTETCRFELYYPLQFNHLENIPGQWVKCLPNCVASDSVHPNNFDMKEMLKRANSRFETTTDIEDLYRTLTYIYALKGLFNSHNIKNWYLWHNGHNKGWSHFTKHDPVLKTWTNILDLDDYWEYDRIASDDLHPNLQGMKQIANIIHNKIQSFK